LIVIDTSVAVKWAIAEVGHDAAVALFDIDEPLSAPDLLLPELAYVLRKKALRGEIERDQARAAIETAKAAFVEWGPSHDLVDAAVALSEQLDHSSYDCFFLAYALGRGVLVSADRVFIDKCKASGFGDFVFQLDDAIDELVAKSALLRGPKTDVFADLERLSGLFKTTIDDLLRRARSAEPGKRFLSTRVYAPALESPAYLAMRKILSKLSRDELQIIIGVSWLGRSYNGAEDWPALLSNASTLATQGFEANAPYILSLIADLAAGRDKLGLPLT